MKSKLLIIGLAAIFLGYGKLRAQELANYNLYIQNSYLYNPASTVSKSNISAFVNSHLQWTGFDEAPKVNTFGISGQITETSGLGLLVYHNSNGIIKETSAKVNYAYKAKLADDHSIQIGSGLGFTSDKLSGMNEYADLSDDVFTDDAFNGMSFLASIGVSYFYKNFEAQFVMPHLYRRNELNYYSIGVLSYNYELNDDWAIKPSVLARGHKSTPIQYDINVTTLWQKMIWAQIGYRSNKSLLLGLGVNYQGAEIAYAYQMNNNQLANISNGTHEIQLIYNFGKSFLSGK